MSKPTVERLIDMLPEWMRSVRWRITILYSTITFLIAAVMLATLYMALFESLHKPTSANDLQGPFRFFTTDESGRVTKLSEPFVRDANAFRQAINTEALDNLKRFSFGALGVLFIVSLGVGWVISGRVLSPIGRIREVADDIQATDLSRRIALAGPEDELKNLADTFDRMLERLDDAFGAQRRFIADASHELRNPLAVMRTNVDVVLNDPNATQEDLRSAAVVVQRATQRMGHLVDDLLALARLEAPRAMSEPVNLSTTALEVADDFAVVARGRSIALGVDVTEEVWVTGDRDALKRAVSNLVENAIVYSPDGAQVRLGAGSFGGWQWVAVEDSGTGIAAEDHDSVFERFWRADKSRSRPGGGSGLGLAIVRQVVESHSGTVRVLSRPGAGATFVVWLPGSRAGMNGELSAPPTGSPLASRAGATSA